MEGIFTISPLGRVISNTGKAKGESSPLLHPPSPAESLLRAECFYVQVGGKESVRASEGNALILTLNLLQFPALPHPSHLRPGTPGCGQGKVLAWHCGTVLGVSRLIPSCVPGSLGKPQGARAQHWHQVQTFPPISWSEREGRGSPAGQKPEGKMALIQSEENWRWDILSGLL